MSNPTKPDLSGIHLWLVLWKAARTIEALAMQSIARFEVGLTDFAVLEVLLHKGPLTVKQIGEKVLLTSGSMTTAVDRLEAKGLVVRGNDAKDRRARIISLTPTGRQLIERAFAEHREAMEQNVAGFSEEDRAVLIPLLKQLGRTGEKNFINAAATSNPAA
jgi:MarR family 2-MHQ and catechol resistance regulon transcriptional repressor